MQIFTELNGRRVYTWAGKQQPRIASDRGGLSVEVSHGLCEPPHRSPLFRTGSGPVNIVWIFSEPDLKVK